MTLSKKKSEMGKKLNKKETDLLATLMLKEAFDNEVVYVHVKIGNHIVMLTKEEFMKIYIPKNKGEN